MMQPFVSVIVPVYNVETFFERCLRSLFGQTLDNIEYVFINDYTPDNSMPLLERVLEEYPHRKEQVRIITHEHNLGLGTARKAGMKAATGKYVISCDSDDWVETDMYEKMYAKAIEEDADIVCCGYRLEYGKGKSIAVYEKVAKGEKRRKSMRDIRWDELHSSVWNKLVRRSLYVDRDVYPYEGVNMWEDWGVTVRLSFLSKKTVILPELLYHYNKQNRGSIIMSATSQYLSFTQEQIKCTQELETFLWEHHAHEKYDVAIQKLKFHAKLPLLYRGHYQEWLRIFPETHSYIWKFPTASLFKWVLCPRQKAIYPIPQQGVPILYKICYTLATHGIFLPYKLRGLLRHLFNLMRVTRG
jgi:glycosyltransferase involved in cell wall biosynthesis